MKRIALFFIASLLLGSSYAQDESLLRKKQFNLEEDVAISGYDPVAYFTPGKAIKGSKDISLVHQGVTYYFSSTANKETFKKNPAAYEPAYGGWCAYAMGAKAEKVTIDPKTFKVLNGKLYLFYNKFFNNTLTEWNKDETNLKKKADASWTKIYH